MPKGTPFEIGAKVKRRGSDMTGTIVGRPIAARSAGGVLMQRVVWDHGFKQNPEGAPTFVTDLDAAPNDL